MKRYRFAGWWCAVAAITLTISPLLRAEASLAAGDSETAAVQNSTPAAASNNRNPEAAPDQKAPAGSAAAIAPAESAAPNQPAAKEASREELRRLDSTEPSQAEANHGKERHENRPSVRGRRPHRGVASEDVRFLQDVRVRAGETVDQAVAIAGNVVIDGRVSDQAVAVLGDTTVNGSVGDQAVSVLGKMTVNGSVGDQVVAVGGNLEVNGHVGGQLVAVGGNVRLGPKAVVNGEMVVVGGSLEKSPGAVVRGSVQYVRLPALSWLFAWARSALFEGRLLSFEGAAGWAWVVAAGFLALYIFLALVFRPGIEKCAETLEQKPGYTILAALLTVLALPLLFLLLTITGIGVVAVPILGVGLMFCRLFGRAAMLAWIGRRFTGNAQGGAFSHPAMAVLIGGLLVAALYLVPVLALIVHMLIGVLGLGMVIYALILATRRNGRKPVPVGAAATPGAAVAAVPVDATVAAAPAPVEASAAPVGEAVPPVVPGVRPVSLPPPVMPVAPAAMLPRAGFWIRLAASFLDAILVGLVAALLHVPGGFLPLFVIYCVVLWALRGTTVGGVVCGLKIVRLDDRRVDWSVAVVRVLAAFLSLAVAGLGFIWVAFDDGRQSWHDKIAGTTIVRMPKGISLI